MRERATSTSGARGRRVATLRGDDGSLVLAVLATIIVGGLATVVLATVISGQRSVRFDQDFTGALHVAEAGVEQSVFMFNAGVVEDGDTGSGELDGNAFTWTATQLDDDGHVFEVVSTGAGSDAVDRTITAIIEDRPLFNLAAFSDVLVNYSGSNTADSYHSIEKEWCTGEGRVGTNDELDFSGTSSGQCTVYDDDDNPVPNATVDGVDLYDWLADEDPGRCVQAGGKPNNCWEDEAETKERFDKHDDPILFSPQIDWATDALETCADEPQYPMRGDLVASDDFPDGSGGATIPPADSDDGPRLNPDDPDSPHVYCAESIEFDVDTTLDGASGEDPVVFVLAESMVLRGHTHVNCDNCEDGGDWKPKDTPVYPEAGALQIYTDSDEPGPGVSDVVAIRQHARIGVAVFAPLGTCGGVGNSAVHLFGAMICGDIRNAGGWQFHYDEALGGLVRTGEFVITRWTEQ